ncbi:MAG TPA: copper resistance CopC family protein [Acidiferrobacter sp.]|nr:copper resistance CopC family protein [Acidiferrobacter sp.]
MRPTFGKLAGIGLLLAFSVPISAQAHAFPARSRPRVGATLSQSPHHIRIWFDAGLEGLFCSLTVKNAAGHIVSSGPGHVVAGSHDRLLETAVPALSPGKYHVYWSVVAVDGHHTQGRYMFRINK